VCFDVTELGKKDSSAMSPVTLRVKVKPNARRSLLAQEADGTWSARLKSPPVDGKANEELVALVAEHFRCGKSAVLIKAGASGRMKLLTVRRA
jgi:uncharacterized protein (TIGR00251 family)